MTISQDLGYTPSHGYYARASATAAPARPRPAVPEWRPQVAIRNVRRKRLATRFSWATAAVVLTAMAAYPASAQAQTPTISLVSLAPGVIEAGIPYSATLVVDSTGSITVQAITVAVRDSAGDALDFPGAVSATIDGTYVFQSGAKSFAAGTYTEFGSYELDNTWYPFASQTLTVTAAPSSGTPNPPPVGIPGAWTSSLNDGPQYDSSTGDVTDSISSLLDWYGATGGLQTPHVDAEDACYNAANVGLDPSGDYVDLSLTDPGTSQPCAAVQKSGGVTETNYGAQIDSENVFQQQYGAFEAEVYLPAESSGKIADWPAFWMTANTLNWPNNGEIDLVEGLDGGNGEYHFHYGAAPPGEGPGGTTDIGPGWHTFGVDWQLARDTTYPQYVLTYYYDGHYVGMIAEPGGSGLLTPVPMDLIFDITHNTAYALTAPATMEVAYARAWTGSYGAVPLQMDSNALCLDDYHSGTANFNVVDVYTCNGTGAQSWDLESNGTIDSSLGGCLDVYYSGTTSGTTVDYHACNGTGAQQWTAGSDGSLVNPESGLCLTDPGASTTNGTQLEIETCTGAADQDWL
jgi:hypothetical protein